MRSIWAELIAAKLKCRHLCFLLVEDHTYDSDMRCFLKFKYNRHELAGITRMSINQILNDNTVERREDTRIAAYCNNVFDDCHDKYSHLLDINADYTLASLGRLDKPCAKNIVEGFCSYLNNHTDMSFNVVLIGDSIVKKRKEYLFKILSKCANANVVCLGNVYPIPLSFAKKIDVFVSTAGSATATYRAGIPTVKVHPITGEPVGVIGLDYLSPQKSMYDSDTNLTIEGCIDRAILERHKIVFEGGLDREYYDKMHAEFQRQLNFVSADNRMDYYNITQLLQLKTVHLRSYRVMWLIGHLLGARSFLSVRRIWGKAK
jgi:hypothetical protein